MGLIEEKLLGEVVIFLLRIVLGRRFLTTQSGRVHSCLIERGLAVIGGGIALAQLTE